MDLREPLDLQRHVFTETHRLSRPFRTAAYTRTEIQLLRVDLSLGGFTGRGESFVHERSGTTLEAELGRARAFPIRHLLGVQRAAGSPGLDALDCALWDLRCKHAGQRAWETLGLEPAPVETMFTVGVDEPSAMQASAAAHRTFSVLKVKVGPDHAIDVVDAVLQGHPEARLVLDGNESWSVADYERLVPQLTAFRVALIEQPLRPEDEHALAGERPIPICADESLRDRLPPGIEQHYDCVNVKLPKAGGLTRARRLQREARARGLGVFVGCMVSTSLAIAPAYLLALDADFVDLDGPLHLDQDRPHACHYDGPLLHPPPPALWG